MFSALSNRLQANRILTELWSLSRNNMDTWEAPTVADNNPQLAPALILFLSNIVFLGRRLERKRVFCCVVMTNSFSLNITMASRSETFSYSADLLFSQVCCLAASRLGQEWFAVWITDGGKNKKSPNHRKTSDPFSVRLLLTHFFPFLCHCPWSKTDRKEVGLLHRSSKNTPVPLCKVWDEATEIPGSAAVPLGSNISPPASVSAHHSGCRSPCFHPGLAPERQEKHVLSSFPTFLLINFAASPRKLKRLNAL